MDSNGRIPATDSESRLCAVDILSHLLVMIRVQRDLQLLTSSLPLDTLWSVPLG